MAKAPNKKSRGRPSGFNEALAARILELAKDGKTDKEISAEIGISEQTFNNWKKAHPDFFESLKDSKAVADELVVASLYMRATGYSHPETKFFFDSKSGEVVRVDTTKHYPPDTTAAIFWLKNRQPDQWRDVHKIEGGDEQKPIQIAYVPKSKR